MVKKQISDQMSIIGWSAFERAAESKNQGCSRIDAVKVIVIYRQK